MTHNFLGPLITAAAVHVDVSIPNFVTQEYLQLDESPRPRTRSQAACKRVGGYIPAPEAPGIGVALDEELLGKAPPAVPAHHQPCPGGSTGRLRWRSDRLPPMTGVSDTARTHRRHRGDSS